MGPVWSAGVAYLVGCVPVSRFASQLAKGRPAEPYVVRLADFAKGFAAWALIERFTPAWPVGQALVLTALVAGEQWPFVGKNQGRLGLWVAAGAVTALTPISPIIWGILWAIGFVASGYMVIGRVTALALFWIVLGFVAGWPIGLATLPASLMILERSREELRLIRSGAVAKHHWRAGS